MFKRCKHQWRLITEDREPSAFEKMVSLGLRPTSMRGYDNDVFEATVIQLVACDRCGSIKKFVTKA